jgi:lipoate-protein ligase A
VTGATRAILAGTLAPAVALATDEALARGGATRASLLLWRTAPAVVLGRFQRADWEVDAAACAGRGAAVWRRFTGGGAVYLDGGVVCVALQLPAGHPHAQAGIPEMYRPLLDGVVRALAAAGVEAERDERTVRVDGRKVTGIAAHRGRGGTFVHGTVLVSADLAALDACIAGPRRGELDGLPRPAPSRPDHVANTGVEGLEQLLLDAFGAEPGELSVRERELVEELGDSRYRDPVWHAGPWAAVTPAAVSDVLGRG